MESRALNVPLLHAAVSDRLEEMIVCGEMQPGQRLYEIELCERLGVSRSPLREAIRKLAANGLLKLEPRRGAVVTPLSKKDAIDLYACRKLVQLECARLAIPRISAANLSRLSEILDLMSKAMEQREHYRYLKLTGDYRAVIDSACPNKVLTELVENLWRRTLRFRFIALQDIKHFSNSIHNHQRLFEFISSRDVEGSVDLMQKMIEMSLNSILKNIDELTTQAS